MTEYNYDIIKERIEKGSSCQHEILKLLCSIADILDSIQYMMIIETVEKPAFLGHYLSKKPNLKKLKNKNK